MPGRKKHSAKFDRCVSDVQASGTAADPYAVCTKTVANPRRRRRKMTMPRSTRRMPAGLRRFWNARKRAARARRAPKRSTRVNPKGFVVIARRGIKRGYYDGARQFNPRAGARVYGSHREASRAAAGLRKRHARALSGWRVGVGHAY